MTCSLAHYKTENRKKIQQTHPHRERERETVIIKDY